LRALAEASQGALEEGEREAADELARVVAGEDVPEAEKVEHLYNATKWTSRSYIAVKKAIVVGGRAGVGLAAGHAFAQMLIDWQPLLQLLARLF